MSERSERSERNEEALGMWDRVEAAAVARAQKWRESYEKRKAEFEEARARQEKERLAKEQAAAEQKEAAANKSTELFNIQKQAMMEARANAHRMLRAPTASEYVEQFAIDKDYLNGFEEQLETHRAALRALLEKRSKLASTIEEREGAVARAKAEVLSVTQRLDDLARDAVSGTYDAAAAAEMQRQGSIAEEALAAVTRSLESLQKVNAELNSEIEAAENAVKSSEMNMAEAQLKVAYSKALNAAERVAAKLMLPLEPLMKETERLYAVAKDLNPTTTALRTETQFKIRQAVRQILLNAL